MVEINQFGSAPPGDPQTCARCEALLMDVLDGVVSAEDQTFFDGHMGSCTGCSQMLADARRGGAWLEMLRDPRPEPPAALFERILAQTSGLALSQQAMQPAASDAMGGIPTNLLGMPQTTATAIGTSSVSAGYAFATRSASSQAGGFKVLPFRVRTMARSVGQTMLQPRLAMTAAMAFFSIALTLNLTGVRVSELRMSDLRPTNLRREFYQANAHVVRYCDNLRVVYELEARAHDIQRNTDGDTPTGSSATHDGEPSDAPKQPAPGPDHPATQKADPKPGPGTSRREPLTPDGLSVATLFPLSVVAFDHVVPTMHPKGDLA